MADLGQLVPVDLAILTAAAMAARVDTLVVVGTCRFRKIGVGQRVRVQIEQMALPFAFGETLSPSTKRPPLVPSQFVECGSVLLLQLLVRGGRFVQHTA